MHSITPYSPPPGYYDLPFTWAFDASIFSNGTSPLGSSIYLLGGYGDFLLRRIVGLNRILAADGTGMFQISRKSRNVFLQSDPVQAPNSVELPIAPDELYLETGRIWFDLYGINLPAKPLTAQVAFQGVRRQAGRKAQPNYKHFPKSFTYQVTVDLASLAGSGVVQPAFRPIVDYDFELYQIILMSAVQPDVIIGDEDIGLMGFVGKLGTRIVSQLNLSGLHNQPATVSIVGTTVTLTSPTNNTGVPIPNPLTNAAFAAQLNAMPAFAALAVARDLGGNYIYNPDVTFFGGATLVTAGSTPSNFTFGPPPPLDFQPITSPICSLTVFDSNKVAISNQPVLDIFYNGGPGSPYENGAMVPPLYYPKDTVLEIDFTSQITNINLLPTTVVAYLVGEQLIPY